MDLLLGHFADAHLASLTPGELDRFEVLLEEADQDLYAWMTGQEPPPNHLADLVERITAHAERNFTQSGFVL